MGGKDKKVKKIEAANRLVQLEMASVENASRIDIAADSPAKGATFAHNPESLNGSPEGKTRMRTQKTSVSLRRHMRGTLTSFPAAARKPDANPILHRKVETQRKRLLRAL